MSLSLKISAKTWCTKDKIPEITMRKFIDFTALSFVNKKNDNRNSYGTEIVLVAPHHPIVDFRLAYLLN